MQINTSQSKVNFSIKKLIVLTVNGNFSQIKGTIDLNENNIAESNIEIIVALVGLDTKNVKRNEHLLQKDFFNAENHPEITFNSNSFTLLNGQYSVKGDLTIAGTTKKIEVPFQFTNNRLVGSFNLNRFDYEVGKIPAFVAAKDVTIKFDLSIG
ncbi:YceI family protein [Fluviicola taffensis]|uniref:YceI family protein n=1 Tax=Fluviicola taffensis TaxID=191579 RepID=UPI003137C413